MTHHDSSIPSNAHLLKATATALLVAAVLFVVAVLPAEFGRDPTGIGTRLGLMALASAAETQPSVPPSTAASAAAPASAAVAGAAAASGGREADAAQAALAAAAAAAFGVQPGQTFDVHAVSAAPGTLRSDSMTVVLPPGKGAEIKAMVDAGQGFVFRWTASGDVAVDMHGEKPDAHDEYTSYRIDASAHEGAGTFRAPFAGQHGWYWRNRGKGPVTVTVQVNGFHTRLFRPGQ